MNRIKLLLSALGIGLLVALFFFFISNNVDKNNAKLNAENISVFEEDETALYLKKAPKNLELEIMSDHPDEVIFDLTDEDGKAVQANVKEVGEGIYRIEAPKSGYAEGKRYELQLGEGTAFVHELLTDAASLVFAIDREEIEHYEFTDQVIELDETIQEVATDTIEVTNYDLEKDMIIIGINDQDEYVAYKIVEVFGDGTARVTYPAIDEIYTELEVYGNYDFDFHDLMASPDIEAEMISNIKNSDFFSNLISKAYAESEQGLVKPDVTFQVDPDTGIVQFKTVITLKAGKDGLFGKKSLKHHEITLTLINELEMKADTAISNVTNWDIAAIRSERFSWSLDINYEPPKIDESTKLSEVFKQDNEEDVKEVIQLLNGMTSDDLTNELKLFKVEVPIPEVPGLIFSVDVHLALHFELKANLNFHNNHQTTTTVGLMYQEGNFSPYFNNEYESSGGGASFKGDLKSKLGVNADIKARLFDEKIAYISLKPEVGLYADAYVALTLHSAKIDEKNTYGYFESGIYFNVETKGHLNLIIKKFDHQKKSADIKKRFDKLSFGDYKVTTGLDTENATLHATDFQIIPAEFTFDYYDIRSEEEVSQVLDPSELTYFLNHDQQLKFRDGKIIIPKTDEEEITIQAVYQDDQKKFYQKDLTIYISENRAGGIIDHELFDEDPMLLMFSSGAGAWRTVLELNSDGTFSGAYTDSNMTVNEAEGYYSTVYISEFEGTFGEIERIDDETYKLRLLELNQKYEIGDEWIEDEAKFVASDPYGLEEGKEFYLYAPGKMKSELDEIVLSWGAYGADDVQELGYWALHNLKLGHTFYSEPYHP